MKKNYKDKGWLKFQYITLNRNPEDIAKECKVDTVTIYHKLRDFDLLKLRGSVVKLKEPQTYQNKEWLTNEYVIKKRKMVDIAKDCNVSEATIRNWLLYFHIKIRGSRMGMWTDKKWLEHQLLDLKKSVPEIAKMCKTHKSTIYLWMRKHNIKIKTEKPKYQDEKWLRHQYEELHKSTPDIEKEFGYNHRTLSYWLKKLSIPIRPPTELKIKGNGKYADKEWLKKQFEDKSKPIYKIAEDSGVCVETLYKWAKKYDIKRDWRFFPPVINQTGKVIDKDNKEAEAWLYEEYWVKGKTLDNIANENNTSPQTLLRWMKLFSIPRRSTFDYKRPSGLERQFIQFIEENNLPFEFVGTDYSKKIDLSKYPDVKWKGYKLLDFIHNTKNIGIELSDKGDIRKLKNLNFKDWAEYEQEVSYALKKAGWKVLFVYEDYLIKPDKVLTDIKKVI